MHWLVLFPKLENVKVTMELFRVGLCLFTAGSLSCLQGIKNRPPDVTVVVNETWSLIQYFLRSTRQKTTDSVVQNVSYTIIIELGAEPLMWDDRVESF